MPTSTPSSAPTAGKETRWRKRAFDSLNNLILSGTLGQKAETFTGLQLNMDETNGNVVGGDDEEKNERCSDWRAFLSGDVLLKLDKLHPLSFTVAVQRSLSQDVGSFETNMLLTCTEANSIFRLIELVFAPTTPSASSLSSKNIAEIKCGATHWFVKECGGVRGVCVAAENTVGVNACKSHKDFCQGNVQEQSALKIAPCTSNGMLGGLTHFAIDFEDKAPAPLVHSINIQALSRNSLMVHGEALVRLPSSGSVTGDGLHCKAVYSGSDGTGINSMYLYNTGAYGAFTIPPSSLVDVPDGALILASANLNITDLPAASSFDVYCTTSSSDGSLLQNDAVYSGMRSGNTLCCKRILMTVTQTSVLQGGDVDNILTATVPSLPHTGILRFAPFLENIDTRMVHRLNHGIFPSTVTVGLNTPPDKVFVFSWSGVGTALLPGDYRIGVDISGATEGDYVSHFAAEMNTISILSNTEPLPAPVISGAKFSNDGASVIVTLTSMSDRGAGEDLVHEFGELYPCQEYLLLFYDGEKLLFGGDDEPQCTWLSDNSLKIFSSTTTHGLLPDVSRVGLSSVAGLRAKCPSSQTTTYCSTWPLSEQTALANAVVINQPDAAVAPSVKISAPATVGPCDVFVVDIGASTGSGGRLWKSAVFSIDSNFEDTEESNEEFQKGKSTLLAFSNSSSFGTNELFIEVSAMSILEATREYTFTFTLCNFLDACTTRFHHLYVQNSYDKPTVLLNGGSYREATRSRELLVSADAYVSLCDGTQDRSGLSFSWSIFEGGIRLDSLASVSKNSRHFLLPAFSLSPLMSYDVKVTVRKGEVSVTDTTTVFITPGTLNPVITRVEVNGGISKGTGSDIPLKPNTIITFSATESFDSDYPNMGDTSIMAQLESFVYDWTCEQNTPVRSYDCSFDMLRHRSQPEMSFEYGSNRSANTTSIVTLKVSLGSRSAETHLLLRATSSAAPTLTIFTEDAALSSMAKSHAAKNRLIVSAAVDFESYIDSGSVTWSVSPRIRGLVLPQVSTLRPTSLNTFTRYTSLVVPANSDMCAGVLYTFTLTCSGGGADVQSSLTIKTNVPPLPGQFDVSPSFGGIELDQLYDFKAMYWVDDDVPLLLSYSFGYTDKSGAFIITRSKRENEFKAALLLPAVGSANDDYIVECVAFIYDTFDANSTAFFKVQVMPSGSSAHTDGNSGMEDKVEGLFDVMNAVLTPIENSGLESDPSMFKNVINVVSTALDVVDCTLPYVIGKCSNLNRKDCSKTARTCGPCLSDEFIGEFGDANSQCLDASALYNSHGDSVGSSVVDDQILVIPDKLCPGDGSCSGHGICVTIGDDLGLSSSCPITSLTCRRECKCDTGFNGDSCGYSDELFTTRLLMKEDLMKALKNLTLVEDVSATGFAEQASTLVSMTAKSDELTQSAKDTAIEMVRTMVDALLSSSSEEEGDAALVAANRAFSVIEQSFLAAKVESAYDDEKRRFLVTAIPSETAHNVEEALLKISQLQMRSVVPDQPAYTSTKQGATSTVLAVSSGALLALEESFHVNSPRSPVEVQNNLPAAVEIVLPVDGIQDKLSYSQSGDFATSMAVRASIPLKVFDDVVGIFDAPDGSALNRVEIEGTLSQTVSFEASLDEGDCDPNDITRRRPVLLTVTHNNEVSDQDANRTIHVKCREGWPEFGTVNCPFGPHPANCSGREDYIQSITCPNRLFEPNCGVDVSLQSICIPIAHTSENTTCECDLCAASRLGFGGGSRRLLNAQDTGYVEITAMSKYVLSDALDVMKEHGVFTNPETIAEAKFVLIAFGIVWLSVISLLVLAEAMHQLGQSEKKKKRELYEIYMDEYVTEQNRSHRRRNAAMEGIGIAGKSNKVKEHLLSSSFLSTQDLAIDQFVSMKHAEILDAVTQKKSGKTMDIASEKALLVFRSGSSSFGMESLRTVSNKVQQALANKVHPSSSPHTATSKIVPAKDSVIMATNGRCRSSSGSSGSCDSDSSSTGTSSGNSSHESHNGGKKSSLLGSSSMKVKSLQHRRTLDTTGTKATLPALASLKGMGVNVAVFDSSTDDSESDWSWDSEESFEDDSAYTRPVTSTHDNAKRKKTRSIAIAMTKARGVVKEGVGANLKREMEEPNQFAKGLINGSMI